MTAQIEPAQTFSGVPCCADLGAPPGGAFVEYVPGKDPSGTGAQAIARLASNVIAAIGEQSGRAARSNVSGDLSANQVRSSAGAGAQEMRAGALSP